MGRPPRQDYLGAIQHANAHAVGDEPLFRNDGDRLWFLKLVGLVTEQFAWRCAAYCLMDNHYHLVIQTTNPTVAAGMQWLNGGFAKSFNQRYKRKGHLFRARYHAEPVVRGEHGLEVVRYLARNPARAGLCAKPENWQWGSYRASLGLAAPQPWIDEALLFSLIGERPGRRARERLRRFVDDGAGDS
jgi:REP element-mobilizing transposase RayT